MEKDLNKTNEVEADQLSDVSGGAFLSVEKTTHTTITNTNTQDINMPMTKNGEGDLISIGNNFSVGSDTSGTDSLKKLGSLFEKFKNF